MIKTEGYNPPYTTRYEQVAPYIHLVHTPTPKLESFAAKLAFPNGGAFFEKPGEEGITHLLEHLKVSELLPSLPLDALSDYLKVRGGYRNGSTRLLGMQLEVYGTREHHIHLMQLLLNLWFKNPLEDDTRFLRERNIVAAEVSNDLVEPANRLQRAINETSFTDPYGRKYEVGGEPEVVRTFTIEQVRRRFNQIIETSPMVIFITGGRPYNRIPGIQRLIDMNTPSDEMLPINYLPKVKLHDAPTTLLLHPAATGNADLHIAFQTEMHDFHRSHARALLSRIMFRPDSGILYKRLRHDLQLIYNLKHGSEHGGQTTLTSITAPLKNIEPIIAECQRLWELPLSKIRALISERLHLEQSSLLAECRKDGDSPFAHTGSVVNNLLNNAKPFTLGQEIASFASVTLDELVEEFAYQQRQYHAHKRLLVVSSNRDIPHDRFDRVVEFD